MKNAKFLINTIHENPLYKEKLSMANECQQLLELMGKAKRFYIAFCYVREGVLTFVLTHPTGLLELRRDSSINDIKRLLKTFCKFNKNSVFNSILTPKPINEINYTKNKKEENIRFVVSKFLKFFNQKEQSAIFYAPASKGEFKNLAKDEQIHQKFEELREILLKKNEQARC